MARHARLDVLNTILELGVVPTFHHDDLETARKLAAACITGGARVLEFLHRSDRALSIFSELARLLARSDPKVILGVGSILDAPTAALYLAQGAEFVVGPNLNPRVVGLCNRRKVACFPGCGSVSEISEAEALGCEIVKLFPSSAIDGPEFVRSLRGPMPWTRVMPTGNGVDFSRESISEWIGAGAAALGMGSNLLDTLLIERGDFDTLAKRVTQVLAWIREARARSS